MNETEAKGIYDNVDKKLSEEFYEKLPPELKNWLADKVEQHEKSEQNKGQLV